MRILTWFGPIERRDEGHTGIKVLKLDLPEKRMTGTPERRYMDVNWWLTKDDALGRTKQRHGICCLTVKGISERGRRSFDQHWPLALVPT